MQNDKPIYLSFLLTFALTACGGGGGGSGGSGFTNSGTTTPATIASSSQDNQLPTSSFSTQTSSSSITGSQLQLISSKRRSSGSSAEISSAASSQIRVITSSSLSSSSYSSSSISSNKSSSVSSSSSSKLSSSSSSTLSSSSSSKPSSSSSSSQFSSSTSSNTTPVLLWHADFNDGIVLGAVQDGATASVVDGAYKLSYPQATDGGQYSWLNYNPPANTKQLYISFKAKMPGNKAGLKFFKVHGQQGPGGSVSNTTVGLDYTGIDDGIGSLYAISFGDGKDPQNDTQNVILLNGEYPDWIGRSYGTTANVQTPMKNAFKAANWGTEWHTFKIMLKFNDGTSTANEIANGAYYLEIDGNVYANATGLFNRHFNSGDISHIEFGGWAQGSRNAPNPAFDIYYDDIVVSSGGWF